MWRGEQLLQQGRDPTNTQDSELPSPAAAPLSLATSCPAQCLHPSSTSSLLCFLPPPLEHLLRAAPALCRCRKRVLLPLVRAGPKGTAGPLWAHWHRQDTSSSFLSRAVFLMVFDPSCQLSHVQKSQSGWLC